MLKNVRWINVSVRASESPKLPDNHEHQSAESEMARVDQIVVLILVSMLVGFVASVLDFVFLQMMVIQIHWLVIGLLLMVIGSVVKSLARKRLVRAGFGTVKDTAYLQVVKGQQLVTDGFYRHIRHPIYCGDIVGKYGWVMMLSSLYGAVFVTIGFAGYLIRIRNEERMLVQAFGEEYKQYQRTTKKLIPHVY